MRSVLNHTPHSTNTNRLQWCDDYYAASVGASGPDAVREYIRNQETHHGKKNVEEECEEFMRVYGFERMLGCVGLGAYAVPSWGG